MHVENIHKLSHDEYQVNHVNYEENSKEQELHECEICGKGVNWNKSAIESHLVRNHDTNLEKYHQQFKDDMELPVFNITDQIKY